MFGIEKSSNRLCPSAVVKANIWGRHERKSGNAIRVFTSGHAKLPRYAFDLFITRH